MTEIWKDIEGYNGIYQISNLGRVKSLGNTNISDCCNGKQKTAGGYHWEFTGGDN